MASFVGKDGSRVSRFRPPESWLGPAFLAARRKGWLRQTRMGFSFMGSKTDYLWTTTDKGHDEALAAAARVAACHEARELWARDWMAVWKTARQSVTGT